MAVYDLTQGIPESIQPGDVLNAPPSLRQIFIDLPAGVFRLEAWGSQGARLSGGKGGYAAGTLTLLDEMALILTTGCNDPYYNDGASDIRLWGNTLYYRALTAGAGGGGGIGTGPALTQGGYGGGNTGGDGSIFIQQTGQIVVCGGGGTRTSGGEAGPYSGANPGGFGVGGGFSGSNPEASYGGGGWYGGGSGGQQSLVTAPGGGGSSFVYCAETAQYVPTGFQLGPDDMLTDAANLAGNQSITEPDGTTGTGHSGDGYIRVTFVSEVEKIPMPTGLAYSGLTENSVTISWNPSANAELYLLYRSGSLLKNDSATEYTDTSIEPGKSYVYSVVARGEGYADSNPANIIIQNPGKLDAPTGFGYSNLTAGSVTLSWNPVSNATEYLISKNGGAEESVLTTTATASIQPGQSYTFTVRAAAAGYYDSDAASISFTNKERLSPLTGFRSSGLSENSVTLSWNPVEHAEEYVLSKESAVVYRGSGTSFTDDSIEPGNAYDYSVYATASNYYSSFGMGISFQNPPRMPTPTIVLSSSSTSSATLWITFATGGTAVLLKNGAEVATHSGTPAQWTYTDDQITPGSLYLYSVYVQATADAYQSLTATLQVRITNYTGVQRQQDYLRSLKRPFTKLCRLRFLNPNNTTAFSLDNNRKNKRSRAFIADGSVTANLQNGQRLSATVTLENTDGAYNFDVNKIWFGQRVAIDEGLVLSNGDEYWRQTGIFVIDNPKENLEPGRNTVTYTLLDKWADVDGTLGGNLKGTYEVPLRTNIFRPMESLLSEDRGNGNPVDNVQPVFTEYYNAKTQKLPDGSDVSMVLSPYTLTEDGDGGTKGSVILGLGGMVNAWVGYDNTGRLRVDPSQDDILDAQKAVLYRFSPEEVTLLGLAYTVKKEDVFNDYIVVGEQMDDYSQPGGRAENYDPKSDTNIHLIGRKPKRESASGYATSTQCRDLAEWRLKRSGILQKAVSISCSQMFHIELNSLVEIVRTDKPGTPIERHLVQGYTRPLASNGQMTITAVSTADFPEATISTWPEET